jgi:hypothetical protein
MSCNHLFLHGCYRILDEYLFGCIIIGLGIQNKNKKDLLLSAENIVPFLLAFVALLWSPLYMTES